MTKSSKKKGSPGLLDPKYVGGLLAILDDDIAVGVVASVFSMNPKDLSLALDVACQVMDLRIKEKRQKKESCIASEATDLLSLTDEELLEFEALMAMPIPDPEDGTGKG